ncbi:hypothetical protein CYMTET_36537 [Cymbomonas tetramitiformis]|uniref:Uncharacterized protein n=1 Tax=Cymbomonas tetramitiformis TaxID=36881 RepID=A0AAE0F7B9_9CHLO|nr:hypothetical protein CYMTET_36537 [Cymbomonas tetramitiformis]
MPIAAPVPSHPLGRLLAGTGASSARLVSTAREPPPADQTDVPSEGFRVPPSRDPTELVAAHPGPVPAQTPPATLSPAPWVAAHPASPPGPVGCCTPPPSPALSVAAHPALPSPGPVGCCTPCPPLPACRLLHTPTPRPVVAAHLADPSPNKSPPTSLYFTSSSSRNLRIDPAATPCASCGQDSATEGLYPGQTSAHGVRRNLQDQFLLFDSAHVPAAPPPNPSDSVEPIGSAVSSPPPPAPNTILNRSSASTPAQSPARVSAFSLSENSIYNPSDSPPLTRSPSATPARSWSAAGTPARSPSQAAARSLSGTLARSVSGMQTYENRMYSGLTLKLCAEELPELTSCCILKSITDCAAMCASFFACG